MSSSVTRVKPSARTLLKKVFASSKRQVPTIDSMAVKSVTVMNLLGRRVRAMNPTMTKSILSSSPLSSPIGGMRGIFTQQKRSLFIQTDSTPNPESIKFIPSGQMVLGESDENKGLYATKSDAAEISRSPLMKKVFTVEGVKSIYLGSDFITVTKYAEAHWMHLQTEIFSAIMDHYESGKPVLTSSPEITDTTIFDDDDEVVALIKELLEQRIRPAVQEDGGDILYVGFDEASGIVQVSLAGSCVGCPSSLGTLKNGVENMLTHYIPEVKGVEAINDESEADGGVVVEKTTTAEPETKKNKTYEERLAAAGIPFSD